MTTLRFKLDGFHSREALDWHLDIPPVKHGDITVRHIPRGGYRALMRRHARKHGVAGAWHANGSYLLFYVDRAGKMRQVTWKEAVPI